MPQASDELRAQMKEYFGDEISEYGPEAFLKSEGYILGADWFWSHPTISNYKTMSRKAFECMMFLAHEWDYGGLRGYQ